VLRRLREQGEQLGKQISRAMPQLAYHQLVALIELSALNGSSHDIGHCGDECHIVIVKLAPLLCMGSEHAVCAPVAASNGGRDTAHDPMLMQQGLEPKS